MRSCGWIHLRRCPGRAAGTRGVRAGRRPAQACFSRCARAELPTGWAGVCGPLRCARRSHPTPCLATARPLQPAIDRLYRNILADKPRVTKFPIDWADNTAEVRWGGTLPEPAGHSKAARGEQGREQALAPATDTLACRPTTRACSPRAWQAAGWRWTAGSDAAPRQPRASSWAAAAWQRHRRPPVDLCSSIPFPADCRTDVGSSCERALLDWLLPRPGRQLALLPLRTPLPPDACAQRPEP